MLSIPLPDPVSAFTYLRLLEEDASKAATVFHLARRKKLLREAEVAAEEDAELAPLFLVHFTPTGFDPRVFDPRDFTDATLRELLRDSVGSAAGDLQCFSDGLRATYRNGRDTLSLLRDGTVEYAVRPSVRKERDQYWLPAATLTANLFQAARTSRAVLERAEIEEAIEVRASLSGGGDYTLRLESEPERGLPYAVVPMPVQFSHTWKDGRERVDAELEDAVHGLWQGLGRWRCFDYDDGEWRYWAQAMR